MRQRGPFLTSILLGMLVVGPIVSCVVETPRVIVTLKANVGYLTFGMLVSELQSLAVAGMLTGLFSGVICARVGCKPRRVALRTMRAMLLLSALLSLPLYLLGWRSLTLLTLAEAVVSLGFCGLAAALTGYFTAIFTGWWEEHCQQPEPPELSTLRPRSTRYRI
jgi:hypothetical protein